MSVLSVINELNIQNQKKILILPIIVFGLIYVKSVVSEDVVSASAAYVEVSRTIDELSYCDENLLKNRETSKRYVGDRNWHFQP